MRVPCYTFHDAFSNYNPLISGVLPIVLKRIHADSEAVITRFYKACIGWIRYKPLFLYITNSGQYEAKITQMQKMLSVSLPHICSYFNRPDFMKIQDELTRYHKNVKVHYGEFLNTQHIWHKLLQHISN